MIGRKLGSYEVVAKLGEGGMGEVYRARDTKLGRDVALKILPGVFAADPDRLRRFEGEARTLAALNHPNIAHVYDAGRLRAEGQAAEVVYLAMELVDGDDLSLHIARGPMPLGEALPIASQIAEALEAAHEQGVIHRDLKPANIKLRNDGTVKVLDFGLAKALGPDGPSATADAMHSPTITAGATAMGMILGTAAYMAPEQARGRAVDRRADIWAFGVVLYEILTGRRLFKGDDVTETLASVIKDTPDFTALPATTPRRLRQIIERCLVRDPKLRLRDIGEARLELAAIATSPSSADDVVTSAVSPGQATRRVPWIAAGLAAGLAVAAVAWFVAGRPAPAIATATEVARFPLTLPEDLQLSPDPRGSLSVSPDGRTLVFLARKGTSGTNHLWLRPLDSTDVKPLAGTDGARLPFWSPDGGQLGFFASSKLKRIDLRTNAITTIADAGNGGGGTWNADGVIVFSPMIEGPLYRVSAGGGTAVQLTTLDAAEVESNHMWPHFLPDGRTFLFQVLGLNNRGIYAGSLDGSPRRLVLKQDGFDMTAVQYSSSGHIVYVRNHQLVGRPFDVERLAVTGEEVALAEGFGIGGPGVPQFSASRGGVLVSRPVGSLSVVQPTWYLRSGATKGTVGPPGQYGTMNISRDGRFAALDQLVAGKEFSSWILDLERGTLARFTTGAYSAQPVWFSDGDRLAFVAVRDTPPNPFVMTLAGVETRLARLPKAVVTGGVTPDGQLVVGSLLAPETNDDLWIFPTTAGTAPSVFLQTPFDENQPRLSADGKWVAFTSNESGANEVYVTSFPKAGRRHRVSMDGGNQPQWNPNGQEVFYRSRNRVMAAPMSVLSSGEPSLGTPRELFAVPDRAGTYVVTDNGQRFLVNVEVTPRSSPPMTILINWPALVRK